VNRLLLNCEIINGNEIFIRDDPDVQGFAEVNLRKTSRLVNISLKKGISNENIPVIIIVTIGILCLG
jgi:hypothetical protein